MLFKAGEYLNRMDALLNLPLDLFYKGRLVTTVLFGFLQSQLGRLKQFLYHDSYFALHGEEPHIVAGLLFLAFTITIAVTTPIIYRLFTPIEIIFAQLRLRVLAILIYLLHFLLRRLFYFTVHPNLFLKLI